MHVTAGIATLIVGAFIVAVAVGLAWVIAVPVAVVLLLLPLAYAVAMMKRRNPEPPADEHETTGLPSSEEASYRPVPPPSERGWTPR